MGNPHQLHIDLIMSLTHPRNSHHLTIIAILNNFQIYQKDYLKSSLYFDN